MYSVPVNIIDTWKSEYFGQSELTPIFQVFLPSSGCWIEGILPVWCFRHSPCWWHHVISFIVLLCRYHYCPDHDYSQHHSPEISAQGLLCHSNGSLRICLLHLCVFCFGGVWHPALFCQQSETKQGQRQKEEKPCMYHFLSGQMNSLWGRIIGFGVGLDWLTYLHSEAQHFVFHDEKRVSELLSRRYRFIYGH